LAWINNRRNEINRKRESFREHRCVANLHFIKSLKEHQEAIEVIKWLKEDVLGIVQGTSETELAEISNLDSAKKLQAYAHLFNQQALSEFASLTQGRQDVDASTGEWDANADDNGKEALSLQRMGSGTADRDVGNKLLQSIEALQQHLLDSIADLEKSEI